MSSLEKEIRLKRKKIKIDEESTVIYDVMPLEKLEEFGNENEKTSLLSLINKILLCCNFSHTNYCISKLNSSINSLIMSNIFYFCIVGPFFDWLYKSSEAKVQKAAIWKRFLLFNIPELLIIFLYQRNCYKKINIKVMSLFCYFSEKFCFDHNKNMNNAYTCIVDPSNFNFLIAPKKAKPIYVNKEEILSKDVFFDSVIAYANGDFGDFDYKQLTPKEEEMYREIFTLINKIEIEVKENNKMIQTGATILGNLSCSCSNNFNILTALSYKIAEFVLGEIYLKNYRKKTQRKELINEKKKEYNKKIMNDGYLLDLNDDIILLFKIKEKYKNFEESYDQLISESQNLLKNYFN